MKVILVIYNFSLKSLSMTMILILAYIICYGSPSDIFTDPNTGRVWNYNYLLKTI